MHMRVPLASSGLRDSDIDLVNKVLRSGNLTMGSEVKNFEKLMCEYLKVKHFIMMNSGSSANLLMFESLLRPTKSRPKLHPGDGILVPAPAVLGVLSWSTPLSCVGSPVSPTGKNALKSVTAGTPGAV